jgi:hypothetical protein
MSEQKESLDGTRLVLVDDNLVWAINESSKIFMEVCSDLDSQICDLELHVKQHKLEIEHYSSSGIRTQKQQDDYIHANVCLKNTNHAMNVIKGKKEELEQIIQIFQKNYNKL